MKTKLSQEQIHLLDSLIENTILPALQEDICIPDMKDVSEEGYPLVFEDRAHVLYRQAINYLRDNL
jgi:hypothetical protein